MSALPAKLFMLARRKASDWWVTTNMAWVRENTGTLLCPRCFRLLPSVFPRPVDLRLDQLPRRRTADCAWHSKVGVMRRDLFDQLKGHMDHFAIGRCLTPTGDVIPTHVSCYRPMIPIRGGPKSNYEQCGAIRYNPIGKPNQYVLRQSLRQAWQVYHDTYTRTLVSGDLSAQVDWSPFKDIELVPIEIRDVPVDGKVLPGDPSEWASLRV
jgi:hypothetical protein